MCGIAGIFYESESAEVERDLLANMTRSLSHRGPDGEGYYTQNGVGLGHRRLAVIDLAHGDQPMIHAETGHAIVFNGEVYNFLDLKNQLIKLGFNFKTNSDSEVLLMAWVAWGARCLDMLEGMFAFAVWDPSDESLHLVRDRLGKKPVYFSMLNNGSCIFGSELKALLSHPDFERRIDKSAVADYLTFGYVPDPKCIYSSAKKLSPGHRVQFKRGREPREFRYWTPSFKKNHDITYEEAVAQTKVYLDQAVQKRLVSDVPLGAFLSGGVDSTGVVASMAVLQDSSPIETFSVGFGDPDFDELSIAIKHSDRYKTNHHEHVVDPLAPDLFDAATRIFDEPFADSSSLPTFQVCAAAREHVTVALSGDGGDESFAGYRRYKWHLQEERVRHLLPKSVRSRVFGFLGDVYPKLDQAPRMFRFKNTFQELSLDAVEAYYLSLAVPDSLLYSTLLSEDFSISLEGYHPLTVLKEHWATCDSDDPVDLALYADWQMWLPGRMLVKVDRASMANSLEVRSPFLDHKFLEWTASLPTSFKIKGLEGKQVLKAALEQRVDPAILYRSKKGFAPPISSWLRVQMRSQLESALKGEHFRDAGYFSLDAVDKMLEQHFSGARDHGPVLWSLLVFEGFLRQHSEH